MILLNTITVTLSLDRTYGEWSSDSSNRITSLMNAGGIPGLSAVLVDMRSGLETTPPPKVSYDNVNRTNGRLFNSGVAASFHFGHSRLGCPDPSAAANMNGESCFVNAASVFGLGRISQLLVSTAVLRSAQQGHVSLDLPISTYLASRSTNLNARKLPSVWTFTTALAGRMARVTLRQLLSHTACIRDGVDVALRHTQAGDTSFSLKQYLRDELTNPENWVPSCTLGSTVEERHYEHSTLGVALAAHVLEYADPAVASDFEKYGQSLLSELGFENAAWKLSSLVNRGELAENYGHGITENDVRREFPKIRSSNVPAYTHVAVKNYCTQRLADLGANVSNGSYYYSGRAKNFEGEMRRVNCTSSLNINLDAASKFLNYGQYGRPAYPGSMLRAKAEDIASFLAMHMNGGNFTAGGAPFLDGSAVEEMFKVHVAAERGNGGLGWLTSVYDNREYVELDSGTRNPGVASIISFSPRSQVGLVLLSNGDMSEGGSDGVLMSKDLSMGAYDALLEIRDYIMDWYEASAATTDSAVASHFTVHGQAQRLNSNKAMVLFELYDIGESSVSYTIYYSFGPGGCYDIPSGIGNNVRLSYKQEVLEFFPQNSTGKLTGALTDLKPSRSYDFNCDIVNQNDDVLSSKVFSFMTLPASANKPSLGLDLNVFSDEGGAVNYTIEFTELQIQDDMHLHFQFFTSVSSGATVVDSNTHLHHMRLFPAVSTGTATGQLKALTPGLEYAFRVDAVDSSHGAQLKSMTRSCVVAGLKTDPPEPARITSTASLWQSIAVNTGQKYPIFPYFEVTYPSVLLGGLEADGSRGSSFPSRSTPTIYSNDMHDSVVHLTESGVWSADNSNNDGNTYQHTSLTVDLTNGDSSSDDYSAMEEQSESNDSVKYSEQTAVTSSQQMSSQQYSGY